MVSIVFYAIQAGREIRIVVKPDKVDDLASHKIARDIKTKIEEELTYPGHIKSYCYKRKFVRVKIAK